MFFVMIRVTSCRSSFSLSIAPPLALAIVLFERLDDNGLSVRRAILRQLHLCMCDESTVCPPGILVQTLGALDKGVELDERVRSQLRLEGFVCRGGIAFETVREISVMNGMTWSEMMS